MKNKWEKAYREADLNTIKMNLKNNEKLCTNALKDVSSAVSESHEKAIENSGEIIKLKDNTIKELIDYGIDDLPMMVRKGHLRENILTAEQASKLGYNIKNKDFHGLGVKKYLEIIDSMDNPIGVYQYTDKGKYDSNNFIVLTPIEIDGKKAIVPVEINNKGTYNKIDIDYNRIKTSCSKDNINYIDNMIEKGALVEIKKNHVQSDSVHSSSSTSNISQSNENVNKNDALSNKYSMQNTENNTWQEHLEKNYKSDGFKTYFKDTRFDNTENKTKHLDPTKESSYGPVKKKGQIYNLDKVIEFM